VAIYPKPRALRRWIHLGYTVERLCRWEGVERGRMGNMRGFERGTWFLY
jgi:hypothetical protein